MKKIIAYVLLVMAWLPMALAATSQHNYHSSSSKKETKKHNKKYYSKRHLAYNGQKKPASMYGLASYYGGVDGFDGKQMANSEVFDSKNINFAAHPSLPLGTKLKVTALATQKSIYVEITDRMPKHSRIIDLSLAGAKAIGIDYKGVSAVKLTKVSDKTFYANRNIVEVDGGSA